MATPYHYAVRLTYHGNGLLVIVSPSSLISHQNCEQHVSTVSDVRWVEINEALQMKLAFDHRNIVLSARERMRQRALYSISPGYALSE
jgi:8-oxo-dGTP diphosphatase